MKPLHAWAIHHHPVSLPPGHRFPSGKHARLLALLIEEGTLDPASVHDAKPAPWEWAARAHDPHYLEQIEHGTLDPHEVRRLGLPWSDALVTRARAALAGTVCAAFAALRQGVAGNLAGGSHHAFRDRPGPYCLFNDAAVAIAMLRAHGAARRPIVIDLDVHQGDGTAAMFADDPTVFTFSIHAGSNFPARKEHGSFDLALADGCDDATYLAELERHMAPALEGHGADFVFYQAGVDGLVEDRLGKLALTHDGLARRDRMVFDSCGERGLPVVFTLGGGYGEPIDASIAAHAGVWRAARRARDVRPAVDDPAPFDHAVDTLLSRH